MKIRLLDEKKEEIKDKEKSKLRAQFQVSNINGQKMPPGLLIGKFVIGCVARNQPRKNPDRLIKTFDLVRQKIPNAVLLLHMDPNDPAAPLSIPNLVRRYNLENKVFFTGMTAFHAFDWEQMNEVYNLMDVHFLPTSGEGFGIPIIEAMSAEVPSVATSYTTTSELLEETGAGFGAKLVGSNQMGLFEYSSPEYDRLNSNGTLTGSWEVERGFIDVFDAAEKICRLYDPKLREKMGKIGRKIVLERYTFDEHVGKPFIKLMESMK